MDVTNGMPAPRPSRVGRRLRRLGLWGVAAVAVAIAAILHLTGRPEVAVVAAVAAGLAAGFQAGIAGLRRLLSAGDGVVGVARAVIEEAVGTRLPVLLVILVVVGLPVLPLLLDPGERLEYRLQFFLTWALSAGGFLLALVTMFLGCGSVCGDIDSQRIHMALVKPLGRWQYLLGKWLGIVLLDGLLVALVGGGVFAVATAVRRLPAADAADRRAVDEEVFTARSVARPEHPRGAEFEADVAAAIDQFEKDDPQAFATDPAGARRRILAQRVLEWHTVTPDTVAGYLFTGLAEARAAAPVMQLRLKPFADAVAVDRAPVRFALWLNDRPFPFKDGRHEEYTLAGGAFHTIEIPTSTIDADGRLRLSIANRNLVPPGQPRPATISFSPGRGLELLHRSGSFAGNFLRCLAVLWAKLAMLAAAALAAASWLGFPIAVLASLLVYVAAVARGFLADAIDIYTGTDRAGAGLVDMVRLRAAVLFERLDRLELWDAAKTLTSFAAEAFLALVPSFGAHDGVTEVATGRLLPVAAAFASVGELGLAYPLVLLACGWALLCRRDLVNVSGF
jgi:hypothetical protein